ncbi:CYIR protein, partial [Plasmodium cynomolgi strain B]
MSGITVSVYNKSPTSDSGDCILKYIEFLEKIKDKIAEFKGKKDADFKNKCEELITYIKEEKQKLKACHTKELQDLHLHDEDIKHFYRICSVNTKYLNSFSPEDEKTIELKDDTKISCETGQDCVKKVEAEKGKEGEAILQVNEKDSRTETLETQKSQDQSESIVDGKDPSIQQVIPHDQQDATSLEASGKHDLEEPEAKVIHPFRLNGPIENRNTYLYVPTIPSNNALGTNPRGTSTQNNFEGESASAGIHQERTSEINNSQSDARKGNPLNGNAHDWQAVGSHTDEDHLSVDKDVAVFSTTEYRAAETSISGKPGDRSSPLIVTDSADDCMISLSSVGTADVGVSSASSDHTTSSVKSNIANASHSELDLTKADDNASTDSKGAHDAVSDAEAKHDKAQCSDKPCNSDSPQ